MKKKNLLAIPLFLLLTLFSSCAVVGGIFKAGVWTGIILVIIVVVIIIYIFSRKSSS